MKRILLILFLLPLFCYSQQFEKNGLGSPKEVYKPY
jgi:hypothetical protein